MARDLTAKQSAFIAYYLGDSRFNGTDAARRAGYQGSDETLRQVASQNLTNPHIAAAVEQAKQEIRNRSIAVREERIRAQADRWEALRQVIEERAFAHAGEAPGAATGLLVRTYKQVGTERMEEWAVDNGLLSEMRQLEQHTAKELGQWVEKTDQTAAALILTPEQLMGLSDDDLNTYLARLSQGTGRSGA